MDGREEGGAKREEGRGRREEGGEREREAGLRDCTTPAGPDPQEQHRNIIYI